MAILFFVLVLFGGLYVVGSFFNKDGHEDFRYGKLTNVLYGLCAVIVFLVIVRIFQ
jgi:di/tricarboxylate transporter